MMHVNFSPFPVLTTDRLVLRQFDMDDADELFFLRSHDDVMKYISRPRPKDIDDIFQLIQKMRDRAATNEGIAWAITLKDDPKLIGHISFHVLIKEHYRAEIGYMLHPGHYGKGIMNEAVAALLHYGFTTMGLHSVMAMVSPDNIASRKLLERNDFVQEGYFKEDFFWEGAFHDTVIYSLIKPAKYVPLISLAPPTLPS